MWEIEAYLNRATITSKFKNDDIKVVFDMSVFEESKLDKSELRDILLNLLWV